MRTMYSIIDGKNNRFNKAGAINKVLGIMQRKNKMTVIDRKTTRLFVKSESVWIFIKEGLLKNFLVNQTPTKMLITEVSTRTKGLRN